VERAELASRIGKASFFAGLPADACRELAEVVRVRNLPRRALLFSEGQEGTEMFLLLSGAIQLHKTSPDGAETVIRMVKPDEVFAEVVLFERTDYPVTSRALRISAAAAFPCRRVRALLDRPAFRDAFIAAMLRRQRYLAERVRELTAYDVEQRFLRFLAAHYGRCSEIAVDLTKKDISAAIGATPETFSRLIKRLESAGGFQWRGRSNNVAPQVWAAVEA
jgi:CRP/FNR family transcriptional regulator